LRDEFLNMTTKHRQQNQTDKCNRTKLKAVCTAEQMQGEEPPCGLAESTCSLYA
jgi:hypothetical protein